MIPKSGGIRFVLATAMVLMSAMSGKALAGNITIDFNGLAGSDGSPFTSYTEYGVIVSTASGSWLVGKNYGDPPPYIYFNAPSGTTITAGIVVTDGGSEYRFSSIDLYSSTTPIPYVFTGFLNGKQVFTTGGTVPNTFGNFASVLNPYSTITIDTHEVTLTDPAAPCCPNPMGLDNIGMVTTTTTPEPSSLMLLGSGLLGVAGVIRRRLNV